MDEQFAATTSEQAVLDEATVHSLRAWMRGSHPRAKRVAWVIAPPGSGLSTLIRVLAREEGLEAVIFSSTQLPTKGYFERACACPLAINGKPKIIVFEDADALVDTDSAFAFAQSVLRSRPATPIVMAGREIRGSRAETLHRLASTHIAFAAPTPTRIASRLRELGLDDDDAARTIAEAARGDVRRAVRVAFSTTPGDAQDVFAHGPEAVERALGSRRRDVDAALELFALDTSVVPAGIFENASKIVGDLDAAARVSEAMSYGDVVDERIHARQTWDLLPVYGVFTVADPLAAVPARNVSVNRYGTVWSKAYQACAKAKMARRMTTARVARGCGVLNVPDLAYVRGMLRRLVFDADPNADGAAALREFCAGAGLHVPEILCVMRLWHDEYKPATHARVKRWMAVVQK